MPEQIADAEGDGRRAPRSTRWLAVGATLGAIAALTASYLPTVSRSGGQPPSAEPAFEAPVGSCLDWTAPDGADVHVVDCAEPHLFETAGTLSMADVFGPAAAFPAENTWLSIVQEKCAPMAAEYLEQKYDPFGRYALGALK